MNFAVGKKDRWSLCKNITRNHDHTVPSGRIFFGRTFDLVSERESLLSRNPIPPLGGPGGPVGRCMGLYADVLGSNLGVGNFFCFFFFEKNTLNLALGFRGFGSRV